MSQRAVEIAGFLAQKGWDSAAAAPIDADFSPRRYARLKHPEGRNAILMDADPDQKTMQFIGIAKILRQCEISAPAIFAADPMQGLVLMEDFGDRNFGRMIDSGEDRKPLYKRAIDVLIHLHKSFDKNMALSIDLPIFDATLFTSQAELFLDAYIPYVQNREASTEKRESFRTIWQQILKPVEALPQTLLLRDYMPDNLMDLPNREDWHSVGVLDFQDGGFGPVAYDLASLCETVRREGGDTIMNEMIGYYYAKAQPAISENDLRNACHILAAQRHIRILGIITQLARKTGRQEKLAWLPRVKKYLDFLIQNPVLQPIERWMDQLQLSNIE